MLHPRCANIKLMRRYVNGNNCIFNQICEYILNLNKNKNLIA
ncbi:MAG: hypothetical protein A4E72_02410 [Syntrophus sp. PtaU1.Bin208]|nr:MAG: hypothetical protein A4E72_02410 [Syntrophus sp. PtaU1.Bin208]